jgi:hypothetical protein
VASIVIAGTVHGRRVGRPLGYRGEASRAKVGDGRGRERLPGSSSVSSPPDEVVTSDASASLRRSAAAAKG